jgi:2-(3-amino-3-carboxypropyl)histidine synthase
MKTLFIEAKYSKPIKLNTNIEKKLPGKIGLVASIQFLHSLPSIKKQLKKAIIAGQVLGCNTKSAEKISNKVKAFLYIGDGKFHPLGIAIKTKKPVFTFNPVNKKFKRIEKKHIENYEKRKKAALVKFLHAEKVGILVSTKKGQYYDINKLKQLEKKYKNKKFYTFIAETISYKQLENFPFIQAWLNTACPRIEEDISILNIEDLR